MPVQIYRYRYVDKNTYMPMHVYACLHLCSVGSILL